ncbi:MAG: hypothetical protein L0Z07_04135 [Planctomycetes bacterium]|nr:hypothetical protein [Planctomycetota bacterium]
MATIIRKDIARGTPSGKMARLVEFSFADMGDQAHEYLDAVRQETAKIVQEAHRQAEHIRRQAEIAGRKAAEEAIERLLEEKVAKRMETLLPTLDQLVAQLNDAKGDLLREWERAAIHVSTAVAQRIIRRELARDPQITLNLIAESLRLATGSAEMTLHVNSEDYQQLRTPMEQLAKSMCQLAPTHIIASSGISVGGCRVETQYGSIDQQIETQIERIEQELA